MRLVAKAKPWSASERENIKPILPGMKDRYSNGSVFYSILLDDAHSVYTIRLCFPTKQTEGFPSFASGNNDDVETLQFEKKMGDLRNGGVFQVEGTGNVRFEESHGSPHTI